MNNLKPASKKNITQKSKPKKSASLKLNSDNSSGNDASASNLKEKTNYKNYAGLSSRSVKTIWEQHDKNETDVSPEVFSKLAEDATYKLWELVNNVKTYARHSSGHVTYDLVNDILKDSNVPPIIGANDGPWDKVEYDGLYFFNTDEVLDLREEYIKDVTIEQSNTLSLSTNWMAESAMGEDLINLYNNICDAIYIGDEDCFEEALRILMNNPHVASLLKLFISKCIEMLAFEYTEDTLKRSLKFLSALTRNLYSSHSDMSLELNLLSIIFVDLLLGQMPVKSPAKSHRSSVSDIENSMKMENGQAAKEDNLIKVENNIYNIIYDNESDKRNMSPIFYNPMVIPMLNNLTSEDSNNSNSNATEELMRSIEKIKQEPEIDKETIKEYEALFSMVQDYGIKAEMENEQQNSNDLQIKPEFDQLENCLQNYNDSQPSQQLTINQNGIDLDTNFQTYQEDENLSTRLSETTTVAENESELDIENITTIICPDQLVEEVCQTIGLCSSKWGFVEQKSTYLIVEMLQKYFVDKKSTQIDYLWLKRATRGLWSIGEFAFRELTQFFQFIDDFKVPESICCYFNCSAIYLRGRSDIFFYEYLNELCGDCLHPFMNNFYKHIEKLSLKHHEKSKQSINENSYKIMPKIVLKTYPKNVRGPSFNNYIQSFPDHERFVQKKIPAKFGFRFAGCRPVSLKARKIKQPIPIIDETKQNFELLNNFNKKVVIARRRILKPDTNHCKVKTFVNYKNMQI